MEKKRVSKGERFWFVNIIGQVSGGIEYTSDIDAALFKKGNYFTTKEEAEAMAKKLHAVLAGADVIQMPSEAEILDAAEGHIEACDEEGHPYSDKIIIK